MVQIWSCCLLTNLTLQTPINLHQVSERRMIRLNDIEVDSVTKRFEDVVAVDNLSMSVEKGELFGLLGPNGAGKSTLTKMISGMLNPTSGTIKVGNHSVQDEPMKVKEILGVVPQDIVLYDYLNAKENLAFYGRLYGLSGKKLKDRINELLQFTQLDEKAVKRHVSTYSGGMKRRVNIAAALLHEPQVLLLDEPTAGLDPQNKHALWEIICNILYLTLSLVLHSYYRIHFWSIWHRSHQPHCCRRS